MRALRQLLPLSCAFGLGLVMGLGLTARAGAYDGLDLYARVLTQINTTYVDPVPTVELVYRSLEGMDDALDPHSAFYPPAVWQQMELDAAGRFMGAGVEALPAPCGLQITRIIKDGPADRSGVRVGDCVTAVQARSLVGLDAATARALLDGAEGEVSTLTVQRGEAVLSVVVAHHRFIETPVQSAWVAPGVLRLRLAWFPPDTAQQLRQEVALRQGEQALDAMILDLRANRGGRTEEAIAVVDSFLRSGLILQTEGRNPSFNQTYTATEQAEDWALPVVVLVDRQTASAAEIVAGALQANGRARLIGEPTYGKAQVQTIFTYEDGSALKLTIARYRLASGLVVAPGVGLTPDERVTRPDGWTEKSSLEADPALQAALYSLSRR